MTNPNDTVAPVQYGVNHDGSPRQPIGGLTKREYFALELVKIFYAENLSDSPLKEAVAAADFLIKKLNETPNV